MGTQKNRLDEHMFKLMNKKIIAILRKLFLLNWPYVIVKEFFEKVHLQTTALPRMQRVTDYINTWSNPLQVLDTMT